MKQPDFIVMAKRLGFESIQSGHRIIVSINDFIQIIHNHRRKLMEINFIDTQTRFTISDRSTLESVYREICKAGNTITKMKKWCDTYLKIKEGA